jgi:cytochrome b
MAYNLWASLIVVCISGILMTTRTFWGVDWVEETHEIVSNWVLISVLLHLGGVAFESWYSKVNLVRAMITGDKEISGHAPAMKPRPR